MTPRKPKPPSWNITMRYDDSSDDRGDYIRRLAEYDLASAEAVDEQRDREAMRRADNDGDTRL